MVLNRQQTSIWTNDGLVYWCIYMSLGVNEFICTSVSIKRGFLNYAKVVTFHIILGCNWLSMLWIHDLCFNLIVYCHYISCSTCLILLCIEEIYGHIIIGFACICSCYCLHNALYWWNNLWYSWAVRSCHPASLWLVLQETMLPWKTVIKPQTNACHPPELHSHVFATIW